MLMASPEAKLILVVPTIEMKNDVKIDAFGYI